MQSYQCSFAGGGNSTNDPSDPTNDLSDALIAFFIILGLLITIIIGILLAFSVKKVMCNYVNYNVARLEKMTKSKGLTTNSYCSGDGQEMN